ncbi:hypothetical protein NL676_012364, partial [Syzygium grande]
MMKRSMSVKGSMDCFNKRSTTLGSTYPSSLGPTLRANGASVSSCKLWQTLQKSEGRKEILPIFFDVELDDIKPKTPLYRDAILNLEREKKLSNERVDAWREALMEVDAIKGWEVKKYRG